MEVVEIPQSFACLTQLLFTEHLTVSGGFGKTPGRNATVTFKLEMNNSLCIKGRQLTNRF